MRRDDFSRRSSFIQDQNPPRRPSSPSASGEVLIKDTGVPVSLAEAAKKEPSKFSDMKRKKKEVNLSELRETLSEVLGEKAEEEKKREPEKGKEEMGKDGALSEGETAQL